jgi:uncharacterized protein DUF5658
MPTMSADVSLDAGSAATQPAHRPRGPDRRSRPTSIFSRHVWFGGRRSGDRRSAGDANTYVDLYEPWLAGALVAIGTLCAVDAVFTLLYLQHGGVEANPVMAQLIETGSQTFVLVKCGVTNVGLLVLCLHKNFRWVKQVVCALLVVYALLFVYHLYLAAAFH